MTRTAQSRLDALAESLGKLGTPVKETGREVWLAGLGALSVARQEGGKVAEQGSKIFDRLVNEGQKFERKAGRFIKAEARDAASRISEAAEKASEPARKAASKLRGAPGPVTFHLLPKNQDWTVRREGSDEDLSLHPNKVSAIEAGRGIARAHVPSHLVIHRADGTIQDSYSYD